MTPLESLLRDWNGERLVLRHDAPTDSWMIVALHSSVLGPATGGTRMRTYASLEAAVEDALRLSQGMTRKYAVAGFPRGGGKAVLAVPADLAAEARLGLLRRYGHLVRELGGAYRTGPDVGTSPADMDVIAEAASPWVHSRTPAAGGAGSSGPLTAVGVLAGIEAACAHVFGSPSLAGRFVAVQGAGSVGEALVALLVDAGASVVVGDVDAEATERLRGRDRVEVVEAESIYDAACDVFSPCALGGVLSEETVPRLRARIVVGGANNPLAGDGVARDLGERGVLYIPDYVVNIGGAMGITGIEAMGWTPDDAREQVAAAVRGGVERILSLVESTGLSTDEAALRVAERRIAEAKSRRPTR